MESLSLKTSRRRGRAANALGLLALLVAVAALGCSDPESAPPAPDDDDSLVDVGGQDPEADPEANNDPGDAGQGDADDPGEPDGGLLAGFGQACRSNTDCESGFCITSPRGFVCTQSCRDDEGCVDIDGIPTSCRLTENFGPDGIRICTPTTSSLCQPCFQDAHCFGGACITIGDGAGDICGLNCRNGGDCPTGTTCQPFSPTGEVLEPAQCLPDNLACDCNAETAGTTRPCVRAEEGIGRCFGVETCDPALGWFGCDAPFPTQELCDGEDNDCNGAVDDGLPSTQACQSENEAGVCNGLALCQGEAGWVCLAQEPALESCDLFDNNCNGRIDEDFRDDEGAYSTIEHCGVCNNNCNGRFDLAEETDCQVIDGVAQCVITRCRRGFVLVGQTTCLPLASSLCSPCEGDAQCNRDVGDVCLDYGDGQRFCGRDCSNLSPFGVECPQGYACDDQTLQCRLSTGNCLCGPNDSFIRPCSIPDPNDPDNNCVGQTICDQGELSACVPPEDACNGLDDDCDGTIDNGLLDADTGAYFTDAHCGRCFNNCPLLFDNPAFHATGVCNGLNAIQRGERAQCVLSCDVGFRDVNSLTVDGCECQILTPQQDDPDPQGIDSDCDGIDGQIVRGLFVSRTGADSNPGTIDLPLRNIQTAINRGGSGRDHVYVSAGVYEESIALRPGISIFGGYSSNFRQRDLAGNETAIFGRAPQPGRLGTVNGLNINASTVVAGFTVVGVDNNTPGGSSYAFHLVGCDGRLSVRNNVVRAGRGGNGLPGASGSAGIAAPDNATQGQPQREASAILCPNNPTDRSEGGAGGSHTCTDQNNNTINTSGGAGGRADCPVFNTPEQTGRVGQSGNRGGLGGAGGFNQLLVTNQFGQCAFCLIPDVPGSTEVGVPGLDGGNGAGGTPGQGCAQGVGRVNSEFEWLAGPRRNGGPEQPNNGAGGDGLKGLPAGDGCSAAKFYARWMCPQPHRARWRIYAAWSTCSPICWRTRCRRCRKAAAALHSRRVPHRQNRSVPAHTLKSMWRTPGRVFHPK